MTDVAILTAITERLDGTFAAEWRAVPDDTLTTGVWAGMPEMEAARRALVTPRFEVDFVDTSDTPGLFEFATTHISKVTISVETVYTFQALSNVDVATRRTLLALAKTNADLARDALLAPGQLSYTSGAVATNLISGCLATQVSSSSVGIDAASGTLRWSQRFDAYVKSEVSGNTGQPNSIQDCLAWWTAGVQNAVIGSSTDVCRVVDRTGQHQNLVANTIALMPALTGSPAYLDFAGEILTTSVFDGEAFLVAPCTFVVALQWDLVNQVTRSGAWNFGSAGTRTTTFLAREAAGANGDRIVSYDGVADVYGPVITGATPHIVTLRYNTSAPYLELRVDGAAASITDIGGALVAGTTSFFTVGSSFSPTAAFDGRIYEAAIYGRALSNADALLVETYMADRIGLSI